MAEINTKLFIEEYLKIKDKSSKIIPLKLNRPQMKLYNALGDQYKQGKPLRAIILKARQMGFSTVVESIIFKRTAMAKNVNSGIVAHIDTASTNLFRMFKLYYDKLPDQLKPTIKASNAKELIFDNNEGTGLKSSIKCLTAGGEGIGRSDTYQNLHISEYAFWGGNKAEILVGLMQAVPNNPETMIIIESTANGFDHFKELWDAAVDGLNDFVPIFCAWWELDEYRMKYNGFILSPEEEKMRDLYNLDNDQLMWRRWCIANNCGGDVDKFRQEYPSCPEEAFLTSGSCMFNQSKVMARIQKCPEPIKVGKFDFDYDGIAISDIKWVDDPRGFIRLYELPQSTPYVIGGDTAGEGSDSFTGQVIDNTSGKQVAVLQHQFDEHLYARQMYCLGMYYNKALIGIETNFSTYAVNELQRLNYPNQYVRQREDSYSHKPAEKFGFRTDKNTRPVAIAEAVKVVDECIDTINDKSTLREMLTFVKNERGRPEAIQGEHDDLVMAFSIAQYIRGQQSVATPVKEKKYVKWREDQWEDFYNAKPEERDYLRSIWGEPA